MSGRERGDVVAADSASDIDRAIEMGKIAITGDYKALCASGRIDVVIDATGNPNVGTLVALEAMGQGKHVVMLNVEADITIGRFLKEEAKKTGVVFTGAGGRRAGLHAGIDFLRPELRLRHRRRRQGQEQRPQIRRHAPRNSRPKPSAAT